ncbi:putative hydrolases or acyltransferase [Polyplosphaeria fusca]|uniref:Hydrolases or acyltransferase n=1 Tax=Polyplosphaeria fusca TaxID=682080 RepID=A0A9P4R7T2_9PLEO|nr:putative hydrolases or acyltransferase [Polyplosphaeria fusca]
MISIGISLLLLNGLVKALPHGEKRSPEPTLEWAPCDLPFSADQKGNISAHGVPIYCTTLDVPLDYTKPDSQDKLPLQLLRVNATKEPIKGSIIFNPGGPGSSGVEEVSMKGPLYREVFGGHWNVIGFDARGTGRTMPFFCDMTNATGTPSKLARRGNDTRLPQTDLYNLLETKAWKDAGIFSEACYNSQKETGHLLSTAFVARDMLKIVDALQKDGEDGMLRFWGRSYSTILGQTFATMFPDRVGRILLDSVLRIDDYYSGQWTTAVRGTELALDNYFRECVAAGPEICPFANMTGPATTADDLHAELGKVFQELVDDPVIVPDTIPPVSPWWQPGGSMLLVNIKTIMYAWLYRPEQYGLLTYLLSEVFARNWTSFTTIPPTPENTTTTPEIPYNLGTSAFHGIACSDNQYRRSSPEEMYSVVRAQEASGSFSDNFSPQVWVCAQWKMEAAEKFTGPFTNITTKNPMLYVSGTHDPITTLSGAWEAAANFHGSRLLVHNGHGHGVMNHPSTCTIKAIHDYFNDGTLPEVGTQCEPDQTAFEYYLDTLAAGEGNSTVQGRSLDTAEKRSLMQGVYEKARTMNKREAVSQEGWL